MVKIMVDLIIKIKVKKLWGNKKMYLQGAIENVKLARKIFPDWICRFYIPDNNYNSINNQHPSYASISHSLDNKICKVPLDVINILKTLGAEIVYKNQNGNWDSMLWRFEAIFDNDVNIMICRDCDSRLSFREKKCVDKWLESDYGFHIIRDHPWHTTRILGGLWGVKKSMYEFIPKFENLLSEYKKRNNNYYQNDQLFLKNTIYPLIKNQCLIHDELIKYGDEKCNNFPSARYKTQYVGQPYDELNLSLISFDKKIHALNSSDKQLNIKREKYELDAKYVILNTSFSGSESWYEYEELFNKMFKDSIYIKKNPTNNDSSGCIFSFNYYNSADIIIYGSKTIKRYMKENNNAKYIYISAEAHDYSDILCDILIDTKYIKTYKQKYNNNNTNKKYIYFPYYSLSFLHRM